MKKQVMHKEWIAPEFTKIVLIGVGGTGSYLAQGLCKLVAGYNLPLGLVFVDPDRVEEKNTHRQNFMAWEVGEPKAKALAFRLAQQFGLKIEALEMTGEDYFQQYRYRFERKTLKVCCVDNFEARINLKEETPILDCGNGLEHGQVIFGNCADAKAIKKESRNWNKTPTIENLPTPVLKAGMETLAKGSKQSTPSCADHPFAEQSVFVNEMASQAALIILGQLLVTKRVKTPAIYFDSGRGRMNPARLSKAYLQI